jgi:hypothetical protein
MPLRPGTARGQSFMNVTEGERPVANNGVVSDDSSSSTSSEDDIQSDDDSSTSSDVQSFSEEDSDSSEELRQKRASGRKFSMSMRPGVIRGQSFNHEFDIKPTPMLENNRSNNNRSIDNSDQEHDSNNNSDRKNEIPLRSSNGHKFSMSLRPGVMRGQSFDHDFEIKPAPLLGSKVRDDEEKNVENVEIPKVSLRDRIRMFEHK